MIISIQLVSDSNQSKLCYVYASQKELALCSAKDLQLEFPTFKFMLGKFATEPSYIEMTSKKKERKKTIE